MNIYDFEDIEQQTNHYLNVVNAYFAKSPEHVSDAAFFNKLAEVSTLYASWIDNLEALTNEIRDQNRFTHPNIQAYTQKEIRKLASKANKIHEKFEGVELELALNY